MKAPDGTLTAPQEIATLLRLLDDGDDTVGRAVEERLILHGRLAIPHLLPLLDSDHPVVAERVGRLVDCITALRPSAEFSALGRIAGASPAGAFPLAHACVALARIAYPEYAVEAFEDALARFARTLGRRLERCEHDGQRLHMLLHYFFTEELFAGNGIDYYHPDNSFVNRVIDTRRGVPITIAVIIMLVARRLHLPVTGVAMPSHFLLRYRTKVIDVFIDPFTGRPLSIDDCSAMAGRAGITLDAAIAEPSDLDIIVRMLHNARNGFERSGDVVSVRVANKCLSILRENS